jgi:hypothetical protein
MFDRASNKAALVFALCIAAFVLTFADAARLRHSRAESLNDRQTLVARLMLTDLALFTEARYTRHPSQADLHSAFQEHPFAFDHFPSGSLLLPLSGLTAFYESVDRKAASSD